MSDEDDVKGTEELAEPTELDEEASDESENEVGSFGDDGNTDDFKAEY